MIDGPQALPGAPWLYSGAPCGLLLTEADGTLLDVNQTFCHWTGFSAAEVVGKRTLQSLFTIGGQIFHQTHWEPLLRMQGSVAEVKLELVCSDGRAVPMLLNAVRREIDGKSFHQIALIVVADRHKYERALLEARKRADTSLIAEQQAQAELRHAQARLRLALDSAELMVWESTVDDPPHRSYEPNVARLLGWSEPAPVDHQAFESALHRDDRACESEAFNGARSDPGGRYSCSFRLNGIDGVQRVVSSTGQGEFDEAGRMLRIVGVLQDVTEATRQRAQAEDRALIAEQMVGIVSHDLRNPLAVIAMNHAALERSAVNPEQRAPLERIDRSAKRAQRLISDLLDFTAARLGSGISVRFAAVDLPQLIGNAADDLRSAYPQRSLIVEGSDLGECFADADRIEQLIGNLVSNAMHYGAPQSPVSIRWRIDSTRFVIDIHNEGPPIDPEIIPELFRPMMQERARRRQNAERNVGLGLFIVSEIARAHGGKVEITSTATSGTQVSADFPRRPPELQGGS